MIEMNNNKGNMVLLTVIAVATLLVAVVGATFAYFSATMDGSESSTTIEVTSGTLSVEYADNSKIGFTNPAVGAIAATKVFTTTGVVTGSSNLNYDASLVITNNTFADGALVYTITSTNTSNNGTTIASTTDPVAIPSGTSTILLGKGTFAGPTTTGSSHNYVVNITYANQDSSYGEKAFEAHISMNQSSK